MMCEREVYLGSRLAPDVYLGVRKLVSNGGRYALAGLEDPSVALEYVVEMRYVDPTSRLDSHLARRNSPLGSTLHEVGQTVARFHTDAPQARSGQGTPAVIRSWVAEQFDELRDMSHLISSRVDLVAAERALLAFVSHHAPLLDQRHSDGHIRECHGDLRAEHVIVEPSIAFLDRVEFNPRLSEIDVTADLAFLFMELHLHGQARLTEALARGYTEGGGDLGPPELLMFYATLRAAIRAKVALLRAIERDPGAGSAVDQAVRHLELAERLRWQARRPVAIALCGVSGSGKSFLARVLAERSGFAHLDSDVVRKELAGLEPSQRADPVYYSGEFSRRTYDCYIVPSRVTRYNAASDRSAQ
jgi:uncharacterized protein